MQFVCFILLRLQSTSEAGRYIEFYWLDRDVLDLQRYGARRDASGCSVIGSISSIRETLFQTLHFQAPRTNLLDAQERHSCVDFVSHSLAARCYSDIPECQWCEKEI